MANNAEALVQQSAEWFLSARNSYFEAKLEAIAITSSSPPREELFANPDGFLVDACISFAKLSWRGIKASLSHVEFVHDYNRVAGSGSISYADGPFVAGLVAGFSKKTE